MPFSATRDLWLVLKARDEGARAMRSFSRDIRMVGDSVAQANLLAARSALRNELAIKRVTGASQADQLATLHRITNIDKEIGSMRVYRASLEESRVSAQKLSSALGGASATMTASGTAMVAAGVLGTAGMKNLVDSAIDYQKQASLTRTQVDKFSSSLKDIEDIGLRVASAVGVSFKEIQPALFDIFSSMEVGAKEAEKLLMVFSKAAVAGQTDIQSAGRATIGILNAFQLPLSSVNHLMDVQFQLVQEGIGSYEEWTQRIGLVTPSAVRAGQSVETMLAALAATTRMGISAARSGTAVSRAFDAMSNPAAVAQMKALGVSALDSSGHFRPIIDVLGELRTQLAKIPPGDRIAKILEIFKGAGGTIEARRFLQNMLLTPGNLELFKSIFQEMSTESGSFEKAYSIMADTAANKSELLNNKWQTLRIKAGEALIPTFLRIVDVVGKIIDKFNSLSPRTQQVIVKIIGLITVLTGISGVLLLVLGTFAAFAAAVVVAGASLFVALGIILAVGVALGGITAALIYSWINFKSFRDIVANTAKTLRDFYQNYVIPTGQAIKKAWKENMEPALSALAKIVKDKILPTFMRLHSFMQSEMIKSAKEIGNNIKDFLIFAFAKLSEIINKYVIPAVDKLATFFKENETTIKQVVGWMIILGKWGVKVALILGVILAAVLSGPVIAALTILIGGFIAIIVIIVKLVNWVKELIRWFKEDVPRAWQTTSDKGKSIWKSIADFFVGIWNSIVSFFVGIWNKIVMVFTTVTNFIASMWSKFWNSDIGGLLKATWNFIASLINLALALLAFEIKWGMKIITDVWTQTWELVKNGVLAIWGFIFPYLKSTWQTIVAIAITIWNSIVEFFKTVWNAIYTNTMIIWGFIFTFLKTTWNNIMFTVKTVWNTFYIIISDNLKRIWDVIRGIFNTIIIIFKDAGSWLFKAGQNIVDGLIRGLTSKLNEAKDKINELTKMIKDHFPFSPAKIGPLSGKGNPYYAGQKISKMLSDGMASKMSLVNNASNLVASASGLPSPSLNGSTSTGRTYNQQIVVNTQELNPRRQAAELGFLLGGGL